MDNAVEKAWDFVLLYGPKILGAVLLLVVGLLVIRLLTRTAAKIMEQKSLDPSLRPFLKTLINLGLKTLLIISVISTLGVEMTSFVAVLGAAGLAIGLALQGTLQNLAGGVVILLLRPFRVGDYIDGGGHSGTVYEIQIFNTILRTLDNSHIVIPNSDLSNSSIKNYSTEELRRIDLTVGIGYGDSYDTARELLLRLASEDERILKDPEVFVALKELNDSSVDIAFRMWVKNSDFWPVKFDMNETIYKSFKNEGLNIPFPQMDIHVVQGGTTQGSPAMSFPTGAA